MRKRKIPKYLNAQIQIAWWEFDEFLLFFIPFISGLFNGYTEAGIISGTILFLVYKRFKESSQEGFLWHFLYRWGFWRRNFVPPSWIKEFVQ